MTFILTVTPDADWMRGVISSPAFPRSRIRIQDPLLPRCPSYVTVEWDSLSDPEEGQSDDAPGFPDPGCRRSGAIVLARVTVAALLVLAAPAVSFLLTAGILGSGTSIRFPAGYPVMVIVTVLVTVAASALGARIAGRAGFAAIRFVLAWWAVISFAVTVAGVSLGRVHLTELGIAILAAALAGIAAGLPLAARR